MRGRDRRGGADPNPTRIGSRIEDADLSHLHEYFSFRSTTRKALAGSSYPGGVAVTDGAADCCRGLLHRGFAFETEH